MDDKRYWAHIEVVYCYSNNKATVTGDANDVPFLTNLWWMVLSFTELVGVLIASSNLLVRLRSVLVETPACSRWNEDGNICDCCLDRISGN